MEEDLSILPYPNLTFHQKICGDYSYSAGHHHRRVKTAAYSGTKMIETIWTLPDKVTYWKGDEQINVRERGREYGEQNK